jgi:hypothetical protein
MEMFQLVEWNTSPLMQLQHEQWEETVVDAPRINYDGCTNKHKNNICILPSGKCGRAYHMPAEHRNLHVQSWKNLSKHPDLKISTAGQTRRSAK